MLWLVSGHTLALLVFYFFTEWEISYNARRIQEDGANNSLHQTFHRQRTLVRVAVIAGTAASVSLFVYMHGPDVVGYVVSLAGLLAIGGGWFFYRFNPGLNVARTLPKYYVSSAAGAASFPDSFIWKRTVKACPPPKAAEPSVDWVLCRKQCAANMLKAWLTGVLLGGILLYLLSWLYFLLA